MPKKMQSLAEMIAVFGMTNNVVLWVFGVSELAFESPKYTFVEEVVAHTHKVTLDVELDAKGRFTVVFGNATDMGCKALLGIKGTFVDTTRIRIDDKMAIPPIPADVK